MSEISFFNKTKIDMNRWESLYGQLLHLSIKVLELDDNLTLSVSWIDKQEALAMNQGYRQQEYVPDVLSFPLGMDEKLSKDIDERELGDLFICYDVALEKATKYHHSAEEEMAFLFVHGFLHLLGYDHEKSTSAEEEMFLLQDRILKTYGITYEVIYDDDSYL